MWQKQQYTDEVDGGQEESDFQKALEMSRIESDGPQLDHGELISEGLNVETKICV